MGASLAIEPGVEALQSAMSELGMREGFDVGLEMSGHGGALDDLITVMNHGGRIALLGLYGQRPDTDMNALIFKGLTVKGIYGREMFETWYKSTALLAAGLDVAPVISHVLPLGRFEEAFDLLRTGRASKVLLDIEAEGDTASDTAAGEPR